VRVSSKERVTECVNAHAVFGGDSILQLLNLRQARALAGVKIKTAVCDEVVELVVVFSRLRMFKCLNEVAVCIGEVVELALLLVPVLPLARVRVLDSVQKVAVTVELVLVLAMGREVECVNEVAAVGGGAVVQVMLMSEIQVFAEVKRRAFVGREAVVKVLVSFQVRVLALASELAVFGDEDVVLVLLSGTVQLLVCQKGCLYRQRHGRSVSSRGARVACVTGMTLKGFASRVSLPQKHAAVNQTLKLRHTTQSRKADVETTAKKSRDPTEPVSFPFCCARCTRERRSLQR